MSRGSKGRRPGTGSARAEILDAARTAFAEHGYEGTTLRAIACAAGVDASLIHHFFGPKEDVFLAAIGQAPRLTPPPPGAPGEAGERILRSCLDQWESPEHRAPVLAVVRSTVSHAQAAARLRHFVAVELHGALAQTHPGPDPAVRATLVGSQLIGLMMTRHVVRMEPLASADPDTVVSLLAPALGRCLNKAPER
ncbi:TetR family transcriptional regulator [Streptomyces sp. V4I2]|uniref:TetR/AcrR family transcriptional regulator n=1 Tax=Streptomyces sp. V4I2 TaxID=3042280 RepID=UPI0027814E97|nr:TetR family transcriptional regulator [Streptomyces sp. V4I2]MDQ1045437.1 AcrR family transcriptional regulator [Streptomyces sp. V4I2]